jgi:beta-glucanase (GH16 family)
MIDPKNLAGTARLTFSDEFNALTPWNGSTGLDFAPGWHVAHNPNSLGFYAGDNQTWYINPTAPQTKAANPLSVNNGVLTITAKPTDPAIAAYAGGQPYTSGQITSFHEFSQTYGYFEMRAKLPAGSGIGSAFQLLAKDNTYPPEIDILEVMGRDPTALFTTAHSASASADHTAVSWNANGPIYSNQGWSRTADLSKEFHTFGLNWQADKITWYLDGAKLFEMNTPSDMHKPMYMLASPGIGEPPGFSGWTGTPAANATAQMQIDYLRAYTDAPVSSPPSTPTATPAPTPTSTSKLNQVLGTGKADELHGTARADAISGGAGDDTLISYAGLDVFTGGAGQDKFWLYNEPTLGNVVTITDMNKDGDDTVYLHHEIHVNIGPSGALAPGAFVVGPRAVDADDRLIYNQQSGALFFDSDGSGHQAGVAKLAQFDPGTVLTASDFFIL